MIFVGFCIWILFQLPLFYTGYWAIKHRLRNIDKL